MKFEYEVSLYTAEDFRDLVYFCSESGECRMEDVPSDQVARLQRMFNERGALGWELAQLSFGKQGLMVVWKRSRGDDSDASV